MNEEKKQWNVAQLLKEPIGATRTYEAIATVLHDEPGINQVGPLTGPVSLLRTNEGVLVEGTFNGVVTVDCSRCLKPVRQAVTVDLVEEFKPTLDVVRGTYLSTDEEDAALLIDDHHVLDISEVLRQAVLLAVPMQVLCRPDCAGFCQTCGQDLNEGDCDCSDEEDDPRWDQLSALLEDTNS